MGTTFSDNAWQKACTAELLRCARLSPWRRKHAWQTARRHFQRVISRAAGASGTVPTRIILADFDLSGENLTGFDLSFCYIVRGNFNRSILKRATLVQSIITDCQFSKTDLCGANLSRASIKDSVTGIESISYDDRTRLDLNPRFIPDNLPKALVDRVHGDHRRFQNGKKRSLIGRAWAKWTNHGRHVWPLVFPIAGVYILFALFHGLFIYFTLTPHDRARAVTGGMLMSSEAMLGIDPSTDMASNLVWRATFHSQAAISLLLLAILIAAITHKTTEPATDA